MFVRRGQYSCAYCKESFERKGQRSWHYAKVHQQQSHLTDGRAFLRNKDGYFSCDACDFQCVYPQGKL